MAQFYTLLTNIGLAKLANAQALGQVVQWSHMAVGDGNGNPTTPNATQTALVRERYRAGINQLTTDPDNPNYLIAELVVPTNVGGWSVHEIGVFDTEGDMVAVANFPATYKPELAEGSGRDLTVRVIVQVSNTATVQLKVDPAIILASQKWVVDNFSKAKILPGGLTNQVLAKKSNADGDTQWVDPTAAVSVIVSTLEETQTLAEGQTIIDLATITTQGLAIFIEGARLRRDQFTINTSTRATLAQSRPAGTKVTLVQNEQTGTNLFARKDGETFTGPVVLAGDAAAPLQAVPKQQLDAAIAGAGVSLRGAFSNLKGSAPGTSAVVTYTADEVITGDGAGKVQSARSVNGTITMTTSGAGGLDTGTVQASTWYYAFVITKDDGTKALLASLSATAPTMPTGYTKWARIGAFRTDGTGNKYPLGFKQSGRKVQYAAVSGTNVAVPPIMASGAAGTPNSATVGVSTINFIPPTAGRISVLMQHLGNGAGATQVGPNSTASLFNGNGIGASLTSTNNVLMHYEFAVESTNIYWANSAGGSVSCMGWEDNI